MFGMKASGFDGVLAMLRNVAEIVPANARKAMHRGADFIVKEAKLNAPVDKHNLEESIHKEATYTGRRGRLSIILAAGGTVNGVNVDNYVMEVHENYDSRRPGPRTLDKMAANPGRKIGAKFLERAVRDAEDKLRKQIIEAVQIGTQGNPV